MRILLVVTLFKVPMFTVRSGYHSILRPTSRHGVVLKTRLSHLIVATVEVRSISITQENRKKPPATDVLLLLLLLLLVGCRRIGNIFCR